MTVAQIIALTAQAFEVDPEAILDRNNDARTVAARHTAMRLAFDQTGKSYPCIGRIFHRHHTTVIHAVRTWPKQVTRHGYTRQAAKAIQSVSGGHE